MKRHLAFFERLPLFLLALALLATPQTHAEEIDAAWYTMHVLPILEDNCIRCHGPEKHKSEFRLDYRNRLVEGGELGPGINESDLAKSALLLAISYKDDQNEMPPKGKLPQAQIDILNKWVIAKAPMPADKLELQEEESDEPEPHVVNDERKNYWAYRPVENPTPPASSNPAWNTTAIDQFIHAKVTAAGLKPNAPAERAKLIRRASYDLTGLPPRFEEVTAFVNDPASDAEAFATVVDNLLARPQYGEKWGRHWLDVVRYAESNGYERDSYKPEVWRYRDWVIKAFNDDLPYTDFIRHQLAGDEVAPGDPDALIATGYYRLGLWDDEPADRLLQKYDILDGVADTSARAFLGMSMGCARCHDHKIDPIPHVDYYSWLAFFHNVRDMQNKGGDMIEVSQDPDALERARAERQQQESELTEKIRAFETEVKLAIDNENAEKAGQVEQSDIIDLKYRFFRDTYEKLPDFDGLRHENEGKLSAGFIDLSPATRDDAIGFVFEGQLVVPRDGTYKFNLDSADGSRLSINGKSVIEYDGIHPAGAPKQGSVKLKKGNVPIRVDYFNKTSANVLNLSWSGPGVPIRSLSRGSETMIKDGRSGGDDWRYTTKVPPGNWLLNDFDDKKWAVGKSGFGRDGTPAIKVNTNWDTNEIWMRKEFNMAAMPFAMNLSVFHDEDIEIYINGEKMFEAKGYINKYIDGPLKGPWKKILKPGRNIMAVHCIQTGGGQGVDVGLGTGKRAAPGARPKSVEELARSEGGRILGKRNKEYIDLKKQRDQLRRKPVTAPGTFKVFGVKENGTKPPQTFVLRRGSPHAKGEQVQPRFPSILTDAPVPEAKPVNNSSGMRTIVANYIANTDNQLTARVMVNRVWQHHFGRGIVATSSDFGNIGSKPTHPELIDWLAHHFMHELDWSIKDLHRVIMNSAAYRMASTGNEQALGADPQNKAFWRMNMRRLTAEEIRDSIINATGQLNLKAGGPSFFSEIPEMILATASTGKGKWGNSPETERNRRAVYNTIRRSLLDPMLASFDLADTDNPCPVRFATTVPTQSLTLLNSKFSNDKAAQFAERLRKASDKPREQIILATRTALNRDPTESEIKDFTEMLADMKTLPDIDDKKALDRLCLLFLNLNEFLFVD